MFAHVNSRSHTGSPTGGNAKGARASEEPAKKPKKPNSEVRKQQNRIASRNYREKRKRKLQYLQQLLKDGTSPDEQAAQASELFEHSRTLSPEYYNQSPATTTLNLPSNACFSTITSTNGNMGPIPATAATYSMSTPLVTSQSLPTFQPWRTSVYDPPPPMNITSWNLPAWSPDLDFTPPASSSSESFQFTPPPTHHSFEQLPTPPRQAHEPVYNEDIFFMGSYGDSRRLDQTSRPLSPYHQLQYQRAP